MSVCARPQSFRRDNAGIAPRLKGRLYPFAIHPETLRGAMTSFLDKRRSKLSPSEQRAAQEEVRREIALAVSIAKRKAEAELQTEAQPADEQA